MPNTREKLIELLKSGGVREFPFNAALADHLIANGVTVQKWIPATERLPQEPPIRVDENGKRWFTVSDRFLVVGAGNRVFEANYTYQNKEFWYRDSLHPVAVSHWMTLPEPPKGE